MDSATINADATDYDCTGRNIRFIVPTINPITPIDGIIAAPHILAGQTIAATNFYEVTKFLLPQPSRIISWITKHLIENRLPEGVQAVDGALPQAAQAIRLIEDRRNTLLLFEGWKGDMGIFDNLVRNRRVTLSSRLLYHPCDELRCSNPVKEVITIKMITVWPKNTKSCRSSRTVQTFRNQSYSIQVRAHG